MARTSVKVELNRKGVREQLLLGLGDVKIEQVLTRAAKSAAPVGTRVEVSRSFGAAGRIRVRIVDPSSNAVDKDMKSGHLQRALTRIRV